MTQCYLLGQIELSAYHSFRGGLSKEGLGVYGIHAFGDSCCRSKVHY